MAKNPTLAAAYEEYTTDQIGTVLNGGYLRLYDGAQPASPTVAVTTQRLLAELQFSNPAFQTAVGGVATAYPITSELDAPRDGTATWARKVTSAGAGVSDGTVGTSDADLILPEVVIAKHARVNVATLTIGNIQSSASPSRSESQSASSSPSRSASASPSMSASASPSVSASVSASVSPSRSPSVSASASASSSPSPSA